jgi:hypothetical protein
VLCRGLWFACRKKCCAVAAGAAAAPAGQQQQEQHDDRQQLQWQAAASEWLGAAAGDILQQFCGGEDGMHSWHGRTARCWSAVTAGDTAGAAALAASAAPTAADRLVALRTAEQQTRLLQRFIFAALQFSCACFRHCIICCQVESYVNLNAGSASYMCCTAVVAVGVARRLVANNEHNTGSYSCSGSHSSLDCRTCFMDMRCWCCTVGMLHSYRALAMHYVTLVQIC